MSATCCDPMKAFVSRIRACYKEMETTELTCELANCVTEEKYHISQNGKINITSCYALLERLDAEQPLTKDMNQMIREECIKKHGYKRYVTSYDPKCEVLQYMTCAYKCPRYNKSPSMCRKLGRDVKTCDPKCDKYLAQKKSKKCNKTRSHIVST
ncbi:unnamed protein product [Arctia plantaginis]|uniref:Uncharacterized protein n=1 Tax=Arctia plantaginis TaxID=874455 RepID=A0A8S0ZBL1_ARCPL|nr:unnamed protein product [Arctia plantaginis]